jgi:two-component system NtrC family sensor kinase
MTAEAAQIFRYFEAGRADLAGGRMAAMDRKYHTVNLEITRTREDVGDIQREQFAEQSRRAAKLRNFEYLIAAFVVMMISCATAYGHRIKRELETRDAERDRYVAELEETSARLAHANTALTEQITGRTEAESKLRRRVDPAAASPRVRRRRPHRVGRRRGLARRAQARGHRERHHA